MKVRTCTWEILPLQKLKEFPSFYTSRYVFYCSDHYVPPEFIRKGVKGGRPYYIPKKKDFEKLIESYKHFEYEQKMDQIERRMEADWKRIDEEKEAKKKKKTTT